MSPPREIGIALLGLGHVGSGVVKLLEDNAAAITARLGARLVVRAIAVRELDKHRLVEVAPSLLTTDVSAAIHRDDVELVCELMGGTTLARAAVLEAIAAGRHVVTANKALLAAHGSEVFAAASQRGVDVYYEAAVCGGVPIIRALREGLASDRIEHLLGIVNGTSNYVLSTMADSGRPFADVLAEAQALGYAEADPALDINGGDAADKLAILVGLCFATTMDGARIHREGITEIEPIDFEYAERFGYVIKPLAIARDHGNAIEARVHPALVPANWLLADVSGAKNALYVHSYALGPSMYYGAGAGMLPTAMAVVSDAIEISRNVSARAAGAPPMRSTVVAEPRPILPIAEVRSRYYLRVHVLDRPGVLGQVTTVLGHHGVSIAQVVQRPAEDTQIVVLTHEAREGGLRDALAQIDALPVVTGRTRVLRIAG
ncbi:MAG: homoserine dehydrogenase [Kofleriaceae bacterium]